jgi:hypothetical protein
MSEPSDDTLKRAFAEAPVAGADEGFVAMLAVGVAARRRARRARRMALLAVLCAAAVCVAWLLAPLALTMSVSSLGNTLLGLPDQLDATVQQASQLPGAMFVGAVLAGIALLLAATAWLARRV